MQSTIEISMYPLREDYEKWIIEFIENLRLNKDIKIKVNSMSTQVTGDYDMVFSILQKEIKVIYEKGIKSSFVVKVLPVGLDLDYQFEPEIGN